MAETTKNRDTDNCMKQRMNFRVNPRIVIRALDSHGVELWRQVVSNNLTYAAGDVFLNAMLRSGPSQVTHLYARFGGELSSQGWLVNLGGDVRLTTRSTFLYNADPGSDLVRGGLWVPVLSAPAKTSSDQSLYSGNQATYFFRIPSNIASIISPEQVSPRANFKAAGLGDDSFIYALGLGVAQNSSDRNQDVIISALQAIGFDDSHPLDGDFGKFSIPPNGQMAIDYTVPFEIVT